MCNLFKESLHKVTAQEIFADERPDVHYHVKQMDTLEYGGLTLLLCFCVAFSLWIHQFSQCADPKSGLEIGKQLVADLGWIRIKSMSWCGRSAGL